jgi:hypothetical protein
LEETKNEEKVSNKSVDDKEEEVNKNDEAENKYRKTKSE